MQKMILLLIALVAFTTGCSDEPSADSASEAEAGAYSAIEQIESDDSREFDSRVDDELADFILEREAELSDVQERGTPIRRSRARVIEPGPKRRATSARRFKKETDRARLQSAVAHVEAVRLGAAQPNPKLVVAAISEASKASPNEDVMRLIFMVFRTSIQQTNADKAYFLSKLQRYNEIGALIAAYQKRIVGAIESGRKCSDDDFDAREVDTSILDGDLRMQADRILERRAWVEDSAGLGRTLREVQSMAEQVRLRREEYRTAFENFDQKANQLFNILSMVMKGIKEMKAATIRNVL